MAETLDRAVHAGIARLTFGLSPAALAGAYLDWAAHLAFSPGKQAKLFGKALRKWAHLGNYALGCCVSGGRGEPCIDPLPQDRRLEWQGWPYNFLHQSFLLQQQWWHNATTDVDGVTRQHENVVEFASRQVLDMVSPSNFLATNPVVQARTLLTGGRNSSRAHATSWKTGNVCCETNRQSERKTLGSGARSRSRRERWSTAIGSSS
jgi:polyhydroxyalkanoate synthase